MKISIITLFPEMFPNILDISILKRAQKKNKVSFELINLRDFGEGKHKTVDDKTYGGGAGMVLKANVLANALLSITNYKHTTEKSSIILMSPTGTPFKQNTARRLSKLNHLIIVCGHYEGVDQRFTDKYVSEEISVGDYILTGGEIPAMVIIDAAVRLIPGVINKEEATKNESFEDGFLEYSQYTKPKLFEHSRVPKILISGNHQEIARWRKEDSLKRTKKKRPDLLK